MNTFTRYDPATEELIWTGNASTQEEVANAFLEAKAAFSLWSAKSFEERKTFLEQFQKALENKQDALALSISQETGKPLWDAKLEVQTLHAKVRLTFEAYAARCADRSVPHPVYKSITRCFPLGVAVVLGPFNFPAHIPHGHILPALLMGNTVIWKPSPLTPKTGEILMEIWQSAGLPSGVLQLLQGGGDLGKALVQREDWDFLGYTGSSQVGLQILEETKLKPEKLIALEMGGNNPLVVSQVDDLAAAICTILQSAFLSTGQRCTCARRLILIQNTKTHKLLDALIQAAQKLSIGPYYTTPEPFMGPLITSQAADHFLSAQKNLLERGATPLLLGKSLEAGSAFVSPAILDVTGVKDVKDEEIFGPLLQVFQVSSLEEAIKEANHTRYGLTAGLLSNNPQDYAIFLKRVKAGLIHWNAPLTGASSAMPFGGIGWSGNYRPSGFYAIDACCYPVASMETPDLNIPKNLPPGLSLPEMTS